MTQVQASSWEIDTEHLDFQQSVRSFVDRHMRPVIEESERAGHPPDVLWKQMGASGLLGLCIPVEHGGSEGDSMAVAILAEELTRASGGLAVSALVSGYMSAPHIARYGTQAQQAKYLPGIASGELISSIAVTEPGTGSDVANIITKATRTPTGWMLDGRKMFITNAGISNVIVIAARTGGAGHRGITTFLVDSDSPGITFGQPLRKMGWHSSDTREVVIDHVEVDDDAILGELDRGFHQIMAAFQLERVVLAAMGLGHAAECLELVKTYVRERDTFGAALGTRQTIRHRIAKMEIEIDAARLLTWQSAARLDEGHPGAARSVATAKYHAAVTACNVADEAVQLFGGSGFLDETPVARHYRDVRVLRIGGGTDEMQLEILSKG